MHPAAANSCGIFLLSADVRTQISHNHRNEMPCRVCRQSGHNIRTCPVVKKVASETRDWGIEQAAEAIAQELGEEAMAEILEVGLDMALPGAGTMLKACRYVIKATR